MTSCRLCGASTIEVFRGTLLSKYDVAYFLCKGCGSLQTEAPHWLAEAYAEHNLAASDTGAALRSLDCQATVYAVARILRFRPDASILDFGGGSGLLCRHLRDCGFDAKLVDLYAANQFAQGFDDDGGRFEIICAFEVAEHFSNPMSEMDRIFGRGARLCIFGTATYRDQGADWWYLSPASGQHVFFYSHRAMATLGAKYGYAYFRASDIHLFLDRTFTRSEAALLTYILNARRLKWVRAYLALRASYANASRDMQRAIGCAE